MDFLYLCIAGLFFVATVGLVKLCDRLSDPRPGDRS